MMLKGSCGRRSLYLELMERGTSDVDRANVQQSEERGMVWRQELGLEHCT